jgi:uncharacterized protein YndB with AHSA1/START domain
MMKNHIPEVSAVVNAPASRVWEALTVPELIKKYAFGVDVETDWKEGSPITYRGEWEGKPFEDKGVIIWFEPEKTLVNTHWSPLSGTPDSPENYHTVRYDLKEEDGKTRVTIMQDNNASEEERQESEKNWKKMLEGLKEVVEESSDVDPI